MKLLASIVSLGNWNTHIFTPQWVAENVFCVPKDDKMNITMNDKNIALTFLWNDLHLFVTENALELKTENVTNERLKMINNIYLHLARTLNHTPISAFGYNINLTLSGDERNIVTDKVDVPKCILGEYMLSSQNFLYVKDFAQRSFNVKYNGDDIVLACNFQYNQIERLLEDYDVFDLMIKDFRDVFDYELSI